MATFNQLTKGHEDECQVLQKQYAEIIQKIERLDERYIEEEINGELYMKFSKKYKAEKREFEGNLLKASQKVSNLEECINLTTEFATKMPSRWLSADYLTKQRIRFLVFPDGICYNRKADGCRTKRINLLFAYIAHLKQVICNEKRGIPGLSLDYASFASLVDLTGQFTNRFWVDLNHINKLIQ